MSSPFDYFVVFAEMRTGSNFLEANLNAFSGISCQGEAFNPHFIGYPNRSEILEVTFQQRTADPMNLIRAVREQDEVLAGFRFFHDHDPRALDIVLNDPRCAKIILTRNPVDSYVSLKIARATGQWKLTDVRRRKDVGKIQFDGDEFKSHVEDLQDFQVRLMKTLQKSGQTAFYVAYEDLQDVDVMNGVARYLGVDETLSELDGSLKRQNPSSIEQKVANFDDISTALRDLDRFNLSRTPNFEPRRGAAVPSYTTAMRAPLLFLPIRSSAEAEVNNWLAAIDDVDSKDLPRKYNQKTLRIWRRTNPGHRSFTVVRHPVARIHHAFCEKILPESQGSYKQIKKTLRKAFKVPLPKDLNDVTTYDVAAHRTAFVAFLKFVKANLAGQTSLRVDSHWASQVELLKGFGEVALPDMIVREDEMVSYLPALAMQVGRMDVPEPPEVAEDAPHPLSSIYDEEIEELVQGIYQRDYLNFGFGAWR